MPKLTVKNQIKPLFKKTLKTKNKGFTLIETIIVVSILAIVSGATISIINVPRQKERAENAARLSNLEAVIKGIQSYEAATGEYPDSDQDFDNVGNPFNGPDAAALSTFMTTWPTDSTYVYYRITDPITSDNYMCISVPITRTGVPNATLKFVAPYDSTLMGGSQDMCANRILGCLSACTNSTSALDVSNCKTLNDSLCST